MYTIISMYLYTAHDNYNLRTFNNYPVYTYVYSSIHFDSGLIVYKNILCWYTIITLYMYMYIMNISIFKNDIVQLSKWKNTPKQVGYKLNIILCLPVHALLCKGLFAYRWPQSSNIILSYVTLFLLVWTWIRLGCHASGANMD